MTVAAGSHAPGHRSPRTAAEVVDAAVRDHTVLVEKMCGTADGDEVMALVERWCRDELGSPVAHVGRAAASSGLVVAVDLADGRELVVKVRPLSQCARIEDSRLLQALLADDGFPAPRPVGRLTPLGPAGVAGAEARLDAGAEVDGHSDAGRAVLASTLRWLVDRATVLAPVEVALHRPWGVALPPDQLWPDPPHDPGFDLAGTGAGAEWIDALAAGFRHRLLAADGRPDVVGHVDWRAEHVMVDTAGGVVAVFDWDALARGPEALVVGQAAAGFSIVWGQVDPHPSVDEAAAFVSAYETARGVPFDPQERDVLDAAHGYVVAYGARCEHSDERTGRAQATDGWRRLLSVRGERALG